MFSKNCAKGIATTPSRMMRRYSCFPYVSPLFFVLKVVPSSLLSGSGAASHFSPLLGFILGFCIQVGELQLDQMSFDPLPSPPRNPLLELCQGSSPGH